MVKSNKKISMMILLAFFFFKGYSQPTTVASQNWDSGTGTSFTATPSMGWVNDATYFYSASHSIHADVPSALNSETYLVSDVIDISPVAFPPNGRGYTKLKFRHICKISPSDTVRVQYRLNVLNWQWTDLPASTYEGTAANYGSKGFNASSYSIWNAADSTVFPSNNWWKEEVFDLSNEVGFEAFQIRFYIKRGNTAGSNVSYGWNIDDVVIVADSIPMLSPIMQWVGTYPTETLFSTGPYTVSASITAATNAALLTPYLHWQQTYNGNTVIDSLAMNYVGGANNVWQSVLPQFEAGSTVDYYIHAKDAAGNEKSIAQSYSIVKPMASQTGTVIVGTGTTTNNEAPVNIDYEYNWSRMIYLASELQANSGGGEITTLAFQCGTNATVSYPNQQCWLRAVDAVSLTNAYEDPATNGATLVWSGTYNLTGPAGNWVTITLNNPFQLPAGKNLMIYWQNRKGSWANSAFTWRHTSTPAIMTAHMRDINSFPTSSGYALNTRPNLQLWMNGSIGLDTSASMLSIDVPDTVAISPSTATPIVVTFKNQGSHNLTTATLYYSLNGGTPISKSWSGSLPWDFNATDTLGSYFSVPNKADTLLVWIKNPNGGIDSVERDDTLQKIIYSTADLSLSWGNTPAATVTSTGIHEVQILCRSLSGATIPNLYLDVTVLDSFNSVSATYSLPFAYISGDRYNVFLQNIPLKSTVQYSVTTTDILGNTLSLAQKSMYVQSINSLASNSVKIETLLSPTLSTTAGIADVKIIIRNTGSQRLDSCEVGFSVNGVVSAAYIWYDSLASDFIDTITVGQYTAIAGNLDQIKAWVALPNGLIDANTNDDTVSLSLYVCSGAISGNIQIGSSAGADFATLTDVKTAMDYCGVNGLIVLELEDYAYTTALDVSIFKDVIKSTDTLIIQSLSGNPAGVSFTVGSNQAACIFSGNVNTYVKNMTFDASTGTHGVVFNSAVNNVEINGCIIKANATTTTTTGGSGIYYVGTSTWQPLGDLRIINNTISGGYYGINIQYANKDNTALSTATTHQRLVGNTVTDWFYYGLYTYYYCNFDSVAYNTFQNRANTGYTYGMRFNTARVDSCVSSNKVILTGGTSDQYGMHFTTVNAPASGAASAALVSNNEVRYLGANGQVFHGLYSNGSKAKYYHNSVFSNGTGYNYLAELATQLVTCPFEIVNNIFAASSTTATNYCLYVTTASNAMPTMGLIDYNNYYSANPSKLAYIGAETTTLSGIQSLSLQNNNSLNVAPAFNGTATDLSLSHGRNVRCPQLPDVVDDIAKNPRYAVTAMGCYQPSVYASDAMLDEIVGITSGVRPATDTVKVKVTNIGSNPLTSIDIKWLVNDSVLSAGANYPLSLATGQSTIITLGTFTYWTDNNIITAIITQLNSGALTDMDATNDTAVYKMKKCTSAYSGYLTVGSTGDFATVADAMSNLAACGVSGDIVLALLSGTYSEGIDFSNNTAIFGTNKVTLTSAANNADSVIIEGQIKFSNSQNIEINAITVGNYTKTESDILLAGNTKNIIIQHCRLLMDTTTTLYVRPICRENTALGTDDSIVIKHNYLDGGESGFYFYATDASNMATRIIFDSNTVINSASYGIYSYYVNFESCNYNSITSRSTGSLTFHCAYLMQSNGNFIGNKMFRRISGGTGSGFYISGLNNTATDTGIIANNEIRLTGATSGSTLSYGFYISSNCSKTKILNNSVYNSGTTTYSRGIQVQATFSGVLKNNLLVGMGSGYPIYVNSAAYLNASQIGYNDYYAPTNVGYLTSARTSISAWQTALSRDATSIRFQPTFVDNTQNLELSDYASGLLVPMQPDVTEDITGMLRSDPTYIGAYTKPAQGLDLSLETIETSVASPWIKNQPISLSINAMNMGADTIYSLTLGWSINGVQQSPNVSYTLPTPLLSMQRASNIPVGNFTVSIGNQDIKVWIIDLNNVAADTVPGNDSVQLSGVGLPLVEWAYPLVGDTIYSHSFDVYATINTQTGAPQTIPELIVYDYISGTVLIDTVIMNPIDATTWHAAVPQQYYSSKAVYSLSVSDNYGNQTITDSVYIIYSMYGEEDNVIVGTGTSTPTYHTPWTTGANYGWARQLYLGSEISSEPTNTIITRLSWEWGINNAPVYTWNNQQCYFKAVSDTVISYSSNIYPPYIDPVAAGATLVFSGSITTVQAAGQWIDIPLDAPFVLPPNMNLLIFWNNHHGSYPNNYNLYYKCRHTSTAPKYMTGFGEGDNAFPYNVVDRPGDMRPNARFTVKSPSKPYNNGNNLSLTEALSPINNKDEQCAYDFMPISVLLSNTGANDYTFSQDSVTLTAQIRRPSGIEDTLQFVLNRGVLPSGKASLIIIDSNYYTANAGVYSFKIWTNSPLDSLSFDDTLVFDYQSVRMTFPVDEYFGDSISEDFFNVALNSTNKWEITAQGTGADSIVVPTFGNNMLSFGGNRGSMAQLSTRQLNIAHANSPTLSFWYWRDTSNSKDYTDVYITTDGGITYTLLLTVEKGNAPGAVPEWIRYNIDLSPYQSGQCTYLLFESMVKSNTNGTQYIDRIQLESQQDMSVASIIREPVTTCDMNNKSLKVVLSNSTAQGIRYENYPTALHVNISGAITQNTVIPLVTGTFAGMSEDTIEIWSNINFIAGNYQITAFIDAIDTTLSNDTVSISFSINPLLSVEVMHNTATATCPLPNTPLQQDILIRNIGNLDMENIVIELKISNNTEVETIMDTLFIALNAGDSILHTILQTYTVPFAPIYNVTANVNPLCNNNLVATQTIIECADVTDIALLSIEMPTGTVADTFGREQYVSVKVENKDPQNDAYNIVLHLKVFDNASVIFSDTAIISSLVAENSVVKTFARPYTVPSVANYSIVVYTESQDRVPANDTLKMSRTAVDTLPNNDIANFDKDGIYLSQNQPNPATNTTKVEYTLPQDGKATFNIYTTAGQVIYTQTIDASVGKNNIIFDINGLSSGIYFYSMEFEGQKLVRKMSVK
ncbi:MAG: T9SS type A sorting domain-containing protein [Bacteroidales bacterium]|jgi:hypothetical protein|nr:T9SS type A sorting domain-containing protein [Bacteroidales bacterium]